VDSPSGPVAARLAALQARRYRQAVCAEVTRLALARLLAEVTESERTAAALGAELAATYQELAFVWYYLLVATSPHGPSATRETARAARIE
jgi:hypothetical protein